MTGKWRWLLWVGGLLIALRIILRAFSSPWDWNSDQWLFAELVFCVVAVAAVWGFVWLRGGKEGVRAHWARMQARASVPMNPKLFRRGLMFWILVAIALVFVFQMMQRPPTGSDHRYPTQIHKA